MGGTGVEHPETDTAETGCQDSELRQTCNNSAESSAAFSGADWSESANLTALAERYGDDFARLAGVWKSISPEARAGILAIATDATGSR